MSKQLSGITGVLANYVSNESQREPADAIEKSKPTPREKPSPRQRKSKARLGRPPGKQDRKSVRKEKATLRIDAQLMNDYRDWSWEARCQLGELVELALSEYHRRHRKSV